MRRPGRRWLLLGWLGAVYVVADFAYWHRRGGAFNPRPHTSTTRTRKGALTRG